MTPPTLPKGYDDPALLLTVAGTPEGNPNGYPPPALDIAAHFKKVAPRRLADQRVGMAQRPTQLFTIGYEARTIEQFVVELRRKRISRVIDVRELPLSRRRGFSKTPLSSTLADAGIDYVHLR